MNILDHISFLHTVICWQVDIFTPHIYVGSMLTNTQDSFILRLHHTEPSEFTGWFLFKRDKIIEELSCVVLLRVDELVVMAI